MRKLIIGYLVIIFLLLSGVGFGYRAMQYDQTLELSQKHMAYLNKLTINDFETVEQSKKHLDHIKNVNDSELRLYQALNSIIKNMANIFLGCALIQGAFLFVLHKRKKSV